MTALTAKVDELFAEWDKPDSPGCALAVIKDGEIIYQRGYGMADLERNVPLSPASVFDIGSTGKQFTAMLIALLARGGALALDDDVHKHLPELPAYEQPITIRHLIHHTSGLRDYTDLMYLSDMPFENFYHEDELFDLICRQKGLNYRPGDEYLYTNTGYFLLGVITSRAAGKSYPDLIREHILEPLGMQATSFNDDARRIVKNRALGYSPKDGGGYGTEISFCGGYGDGAIISTVEDLFLWDQNYYDNKLGGGQDLIRGMLEPGKLNSGGTLDYAFGLRVSKYRGLDLVSHGGSWAGYRAEMVRFPDQKFSVICLANLTSINPSQLALRVADLYLSEAFTEPSPSASEGTSDSLESATGQTTSASQMTSGQLADYTGLYRSEELNAAYKIFLEGDQLRVKRGYAPTEVLQPVTQNQFTSSGLTLQFVRDEQGKVSAFDLGADQVRSIRLPKLDHQVYLSPEMKDCPNCGSPLQKGTPSCFCCGTAIAWQ